jgi:hypothetical protein
VPDVGGEPEPDGGVPDSDPDPLPMSGQFLVDLEPVFELEPELDPEVPLPEVDEGVVAELPDDELELVPELPVVVDVVAALATRAPPATRPDVNAPTARTLRRRICMVFCPSVSLRRPRVSRYRRRCAPDLSAAAERHCQVYRVVRRNDDDAQLRPAPTYRPRHDDAQPPCRVRTAERYRRRREVQCLVARQQ